MTKVILYLILFVMGFWLFIVSLGNHLTTIQEYSQNREKTIEMINNLDAPAAGNNN